MAISGIRPPDDVPKLPTTAWFALVVGLASAMVSAYWAAGGRLLLDTVGGAFERLGRSGGASEVGLLAIVVLLKVVAGVLPLAAIRLTGTSSRWRVLRGFAWVEAGVLAGYGLVYTGVGVLVEVGVLSASADADRHAMAWHAFFWDPWFLLWGILIIVALLRSRPAIRLSPLAKAPQAESLSNRHRLVKARMVMWLAGSAVGAAVIALPDDDTRIFTLSRAHGPSLVDGLGIVILVAAWVPLVALLWSKPRCSSPPRSRPARPPRVTARSGCSATLPPARTGCSAPTDRRGSSSPLPRRTPPAAGAYTPPREALSSGSARWGDFDE